MGLKYIFKLDLFFKFFFYNCTLANVPNFSVVCFPKFTGDGSNSSLNWIICNKQDFVPTQAHIDVTLRLYTPNVLASYTILAVNTIMWT